MTNVSVVEKISELMQQIEVNSPRVAALHYCLSEAARHIAELEQKLAESQCEFRAADATIENLQMQVEKLAAENTGLKSKGRELLSESCAVYAKLNKLIDPAIGDFADGQTLHEFQFVLDCETPATDAYMRERSE